MCLTFKLGSVVISTSVNIILFYLIWCLISLQTYAAKHPDSQSLLESVNNKYYYYTRTRGLFRNCYPKERPPASAGKCFNANENNNWDKFLNWISPFAPYLNGEINLHENKKQPVDPATVFALATCFASKCGNTHTHTRTHWSTKWLSRNLCNEIHYFCGRLLSECVENENKKHLLWITRNWTNCSQ